MNPRQCEGKSGIRHWVSLLGMTLAVLLGITTARADFIITVGSASETAGSTGDSLDVTLTNHGNTAQSFGSFSFEISTPATSGITFTSATTATADTYIFGSNSVFGPTIGSGAGSSLSASDLSSNINGDSVAAGATVGLGHVFFDVAAGTSPGPITVTLAPFPATSLTDNNLNNVGFTGINGTITVTPSGSAVPEPSTLLLLSTGLAFLGIGCRRSRFRAKPQAAAN